MAPKPAAATAAAAARSEPVKLRFNFRYQPWREVLDWFAQQAGFSLVADAPPTGTFNYTDDKEFTPSEAIDLLNGVLLTKGYTLVRRQRMLMLINLQDGIPPNLVPVVTLEELDGRGEFELVSVPFPLTRISPEDAESEAKKLLGPQGSTSLLTASRQLLVTDAAGRLRAIRDIFKRLDAGDGGAAAQVRVFDLKHANPQAVLEVLRQLLDIPVDKMATADGSVRFAIDAVNQRLMVTGKPEKMTRVQEILKTLDLPDAGDRPPAAVEAAPQLEVYPITGADPESTLKVMQTLLSGSTDVRLALDPKTNNLVALARPSQHATIRATLEQIQRDGRRLEVIPLRVLDPQTALGQIKKLYGETPGGTAPQLEADQAGRRLLIHGTETQIQQIHALLAKMGESPTEGGSGGAVRVTPLNPGSIRSALERIQEVWPTLRANKVRIVRPSPSIPAVRPNAEDAERLEQPHQPPSEAKAAGPTAEKPVVPKPPAAAPPAAPVKPAPEKPEPAKPAPAPGKTAAWSAAIFHLVSEKGTASPAAKAEQAQAAEPPPIIVAPGPGGVLIASADIEALNEFEQLLITLAGSNLTASSPYTVFYLKHAKAASVAESLDAIFGGGTLPPGGSPMGEGGGMFGGFGGPSGASGPSGVSAAPTSVKITPDNRLNALVVQAGANDLDTIEQLLKVLDQKESPEDILVAAKPRMIPVLNTQAAEVADILRQLYQDRMATAGGGAAGANARQPSPLDFLQMLRGGRRGGMGGAQQGGSTKTADEQPKMSIGVDSRSNSLVVIAADPLFQEIKQLVEQLDDEAAESSQIMQVVTLEKTNLSALQQALAALVGEGAQIGVARGAQQAGSRGFSPGMYGQPGMGMPSYGQPGGGFGGGFTPSYSRPSFMGGGSSGYGGYSGPTGGYSGSGRGYGRSGYPSGGQYQGGAMPGGSQYPGGGAVPFGTAPFGGSRGSFQGGGYGGRSGGSPSMFPNSGRSSGGGSSGRSGRSR